MCGPDHGGIRDGTRIKSYKKIYENNQRQGFINRDHEIAYGFGGPSEKNVSPH